jgi:hypothetical protein
VVPIPFNEHSAKLLRALGFTFIQHEETREDVGDAENGPRVGGGPAYDEWTNGVTSVYVFNGAVQGIEACPPGGSMFATEDEAYAGQYRALDDLF